MLAKIDLTDAFATEVAVVDPSGDVGYANKKWNDTAKQGGLDLARRWNYFTECQAATARGCPEASDVALGLRQVLDGASDLFVTTYACPFGGRYHWYQVLISPIYRGDQRHAMTMHVDVSALQRDPLTKLPNRTLFDAQLDFAIASAKDGNGRVGLLLVDVNNLKLINDRYGHAAGDCAIRSVAKCLSEIFERHGVVARIGGDEFAVVLTEIADDVSARRLQNEFEGCLGKRRGSGEECLSQERTTDDKTPDISASLGFAVWPKDGASAKALLAAADQRMYANKHKRRRHIA